jgi:hypothetical protein
MNEIYLNHAINLLDGNNWKFNEMWAVLCKSYQTFQNGKFCRFQYKLCAICVFRYVFEPTGNGKLCSHVIIYEKYLISA